MACSQPPLRDSLHRLEKHSWRHGRSLRISSQHMPTSSTHTQPAQQMSTCHSCRLVMAPAKDGAALREAPPQFHATLNGLHFVCVWPNSPNVTPFQYSLRNTLGVTFPNKLGQKQEQCLQAGQAAQAAKACAVQDHTNHGCLPQRRTWIRSCVKLFCTRTLSSTSFVEASMPH